MKALKMGLLILCFLSASCRLALPPETPAPSSSTDCYYVWASQALPELSERVDALLQKMDRRVNGSAYAFGENCVHEDGSSNFLTKETDFRVTVRVTDLGDQEALGIWIRRVMEALNELSPAEIPGAQPGRVEFTFEKNRNEQLRLQVPIPEYESLPAGLSGTQIFARFQPSP